MRSLPELQEEARKYGLDDSGKREEIMDRLRDHLGTPDPGMQIDPMKAKDLKREIDWTIPGAEKFRGIKDLDKYVLEPKLDGARMRLHLGTAQNSMNSGRRSVQTHAYIDRTDNFPHMRDAAVADLAGTILDGELLPPSHQITTKSGVETDSLLNAAVALVNCEPDKAVWVQQSQGWAKFVAFDVLAVKGEDVTKLPLTTRREMLEKIIERLQMECPEIEITAQHEATPEKIQEFLDLGYEGGMLKSKTGPYQAGKRSAHWLKVKTMSTADGFIIGSNPGKGRNEGMVGSLKIAILQDGIPVHVADVGGFDDETRKEITGPDGEVNALLLDTVIEFMGQGVTKNRRVRHPHFVRWRPDKSMSDCGPDQLDNFPRV